MKRNRIILVTTLVIIYLVITAGAVVRMTGSGMGCPDWPKCFGYLVPPTSEEQLEWKANYSYSKGTVIIRSNALEVAQSDFTSSDQYESTNWKKYDKHDYALFNPWHTWIEYINRLLGALAGLSTLALFLSSWFTQPKRIDLRLLSSLLLIGILFQAWLGATVVYSELNPIKISIHMLMALVLVALLFVYYEKTYQQELFQSSSRLSRLLFISVALTLFQVLLGTQVRQYVDDQIDLMKPADNWLSPAPLLFYIHRSYSIIVVLFQIYLLKKIKEQYQKLLQLQVIVSVLTLIAVLSGIVMYYFDFPFSTQPIHLVIASALFGWQVFLWLKSYRIVKPT